MYPAGAAATSPAASATSATPATLAPQQPVESATAYALKGIASWYGGRFNGRHTASGERFDMNAMTACHPTLPFGTVVRVKNMVNKRSVVVRITDRGALQEGRIIDLSLGAARMLAMTKDGLAPVELEVLSLGHPHSRK